MYKSLVILLSIWGLLWSGQQAHAQPADDWSLHRQGFDANLVARYEATIIRNPCDVGALSGLINLYRKYRSVAQLVAHFSALEKSHPDRYEYPFVLGQILAHVGQSKG